MGPGGKYRRIFSIEAPWIHEIANKWIGLFLLTFGYLMAFHTILFLHMSQYFMNGFRTMTAFTNSDVLAFLVIRVVTNIAAFEGNAMMSGFHINHFLPLYLAFSMTIFTTGYGGSHT
jgi:hypothetical protein